MSPQTELKATVAVCAIGIVYFGWKAWTVEPDSKALYLAFIIVSIVVCRRAVDDVKRKMKAAEEKAKADDTDDQKMES